MITSFALFTGRRCAHVVIAVITTFFGFLCGPLLTIQNKIEIDTTIDTANTILNEINMQSSIQLQNNVNYLERGEFARSFASTKKHPFLALDQLLLMCHRLIRKFLCGSFDLVQSVQQYITHDNPKFEMQLKSIKWLLLIIDTIYEFAEIIDQNCTDR